MEGITKVLKTTLRVLLRLTLNGLAAFLFYVLFLLAVWTAVQIWGLF